MSSSDTPYDIEHIAGDGEYAIEVVSGSRHQQRLEWLVQGRDEEPKDYACTAVLTHEPGNPVDPNAVSVTVLGTRVGFLPRDAAASFVAASQTWGFVQATCDAIVEAGWYRSADDKGDFCVRLDADPEFIPAEAPIGIAPIAAAPVAVAAAPRKSGYDVRSMVLGAAATIALLAVVGVASVFMQADERDTGRRVAVAAIEQPATPAPRPAPAAPMRSVELSPPLASGGEAKQPGVGEMKETGAVATRPVEVRRNVEAATIPLAAPGSDPKPAPLASSGLRPSAQAVPPAADGQPLPSQEATAATTSVVTGIAGVSLPREPAAAAGPGEVRTAETPDTLIADQQRAIAALPAPVAEEVEAATDGRQASIAPVASEAPPPFMNAVSPPPPPSPLPRPHPPDSAEGEATAASVAAPAPKPEPTARQERRRPRFTNRSRSAKSSSRSRTRYTRRAARRTAQERVNPQPPTVAAPAPAPVAVARPPSSAFDPNNTPAARMLQGWTDELSSASSRVQERQRTR